MRNDGLGIWLKTYSISNIAIDFVIKNEGSDIYLSKKPWYNVLVAWLNIYILRLGSNLLIEYNLKSAIR